MRYISLYLSLVLSFSLDACVCAYRAAKREQKFLLVSRVGEREKKPIRLSLGLQFFRV